MPDDARFTRKAIEELQAARASFDTADAALRMTPDDIACEEELDAAAQRLGIASSLVRRDPGARTQALALGLNPSDLLQQAISAQARFEADREARAKASAVEITSLGQRHRRDDDVEHHVVIGRSRTGHYHFAVADAEGLQTLAWSGPFDTRHEAEDRGEQARQGLMHEDAPELEPQLDFGR